MNYQNEIDKKRREIEELQKKQTQELVEVFPDISGKFYRPSSFTFYSVISVDHVIGKDRCLCSVLKVTYNSRSLHQSAIVYSSNVEINLDDGVECPAGSFNGALNSALHHFINISNKNQE